MSILINKNNSGDVQVIEGEKTQTLFPNRKCGAVTLTAGDIGYDDSETYASGTVGVEISTLKSDITNITAQVNATLIEDTASGAIASFPDGANGVPVKDLSVAIEPVQSGTGDPSPTNVRPISGHTQAKVTRSGKNIWDEQWEVGQIESDGTIGASSNRIVSKNFIPVKSGITYCMSWENSSTRGRGAYYDSGKNFVQYFADFPTSNVEVDGNRKYSTFTVPSGVYYVKFCTNMAYGATYLNDISINYPSSDTAYHAYSGNTYTIDLNGTRYGGTLDVSTGVLTVDRVIMDLGTIPESSWRYNHASSGAFDTSAIASVVKNNNCICSNYKTLESPTGTNISANDYFVAINKKDDGTAYSGNYGIGALVVKDTNYTDVSTFVTAMSGVKLCYKLATPFTVQLTAQDDITTLKGQNNIWADTGDTTVEYYADTKLYIQKVIS